MTATLEEIHRDPAILDRAIEQQQRLEILHHGHVAAQVVPCAPGRDFPTTVFSLPVHRGGHGVQPGVTLDDRGQMWDLAGGV